MAIIERLKFKPVPMSTKLELGSSGRIPCKADGRIPPEIRWIKEDRPDLPDHVQNIGGTLQFAVVESGDSGLYTCVATNDQGTINVTVRVEIIGQ